MLESNSRTVPKHANLSRLDPMHVVRLYDSSECCEQPMKDKFDKLHFVIIALDLWLG
jgi:hypothetical protein